MLSTRPGDGPRSLPAPRRIGAGPPLRCTGIDAGVNDVGGTLVASRRCAVTRRTPARSHQWASGRTAHPTTPSSAHGQSASRSWNPCRAPARIFLMIMLAVLRGGISSAHPLRTAQSSGWHVPSPIRIPFGVMNPGSRPAHVERSHSTAFRLRSRQSRALDLESDLGYRR